MCQMVADHVVPFLLRQPGRLPLRQHCLRVLGPSEAVLGERIAAFMHHDRDPLVGVTASAGLLTVRIVGRGTDTAAAAAACEHTAVQLRPLLGNWLVAEGEAPLHEIAAQRLLQSGTTIALAESCTGGLAAARLAEVPGISAVLKGGVVSYSNAAKVDVLGVAPALLDQHGAVSEPVARAMASGVRQRFGAQLGLAVTGIAGPGGGSPEKPVGTVCFGVDSGGGSGAGATAYTLQIADLGRAFVRERAVLEVCAAILRLLRAADPTAAAARGAPAKPAGP
jgi:PncC family amidohydrolase